MQFFPQCKYSAVGGLVYTSWHRVTHSRNLTVKMVPDIWGACVQTSNRCRLLGAHLLQAVLRVRIEGLPDWSCPVVIGNSVGVRPLGMALVMCVLVNSGGALFFAGGLRAGSVSASAGDVTARATHFVPICWILAERLPVADSARQTTYSCGGFRDVSTTAGAIKAAPNLKRCTQSCQYYVIEGR